MMERMLTELVNPKSLRFAAASMTLSDGAIDLRVAAQTEPGKASPLLDLIADQKVSLQMMHPVPKDSIGAVTLALTDGEGHFKRLMAVADKIVGDDGPKPSDQIKLIVVFGKFLNEMAANRAGTAHDKHATARIKRVGAHDIF